MNLKIALLALATLVPSATAASMTASPYTAPTESAPTIASAILSQIGNPGLSGYDYLVVATPGLAIPDPESSSNIPTTAIVISAAITFWFFTLLVWQRWAIRPNHRVFSRRRKRTMRKMSHI